MVFTNSRKFLLIVLISTFFQSVSAIALFIFLDLMACSCSSILVGSILVSLIPQKLPIPHGIL